MFRHKKWPDQARVAFDRIVLRTKLRNDAPSPRGANGQLPNGFVLVLFKARKNVKHCVDFGVRHYECAFFCNNSGYSVRLVIWRLSATNIYIYIYIYVRNVANGSRLYSPIGAPAQPNSPLFHIFLQVRERFSVFFSSVMP